MERDHYIKLVLCQHLLDIKTYERLSFTNATNILLEFKTELLDLLTLYKHALSDYETKYFNNALNTKSRIPQLYGTPKVHKLPD